jgi:hypothetical protein
MYTDFSFFLNEKCGMHVLKKLIIRREERRVSSP